jgi:hypothetical protein
LDGDDVWMPEKLEAIEKEFLQDEEVVLVSHDFIRVDENLQGLNTRRITKSHAKKDWSNRLLKKTQRRPYEASVGILENWTIGF